MFIFCWEFARSDCWFWNEGKLYRAREFTKNDLVIIIIIFFFFFFRRMIKIQLLLSSNFLLIQVVNPNISKALRHLVLSGNHHLINAPTPSACKFQRKKLHHSPLDPHPGLLITKFAVELIVTIYIHEAANSSVVSVLDCWAQVHQFET